MEEGTLQIMKGVDESTAQVYFQWQLKQLINSRSKERKLGIILEGQGRKDFVFETLKVGRGRGCVCVVGGEGGDVWWEGREEMCGGRGGRDVQCVRLKAHTLFPLWLQAREHFCQVIQVLKKKHQTANTQQEQDSITVFTGTFNMGEPYARPARAETEQLVHALFVDCGVQPDRASCFTKMRRYTLASFRTEFTILCSIATVLEGLFGEYHSSSTGPTASRSHQATTCLWLAGNSRVADYVKPPLHASTTEGSLCGGECNGSKSNQVFLLLGYLVKIAHTLLLQSIT